MENLRHNGSCTLVRSSVNGEVKQIRITTIGGVINPGMNLLDIVPLEGALVVDTHVRPADNAFLRSNLLAKVRFTVGDYVARAAR